MSKDWYRNGWNRNNLLFTSGDRERSLGQGITNCVYTNNRFDLQPKIHATQSDLCLLILSTSLLVDICRSGAVTQDFILSRWGRRRSFLSLFNLWATLLSPLSGSKFLEWQAENRRTSGTMRYFEIIIYGSLGNWKYYSLLTGSSEGVAFKNV